MDYEAKVRFQVAARNAGSDASKITKQLIAYWMGEPGAELPPRPTEGTP